MLNGEGSGLEVESGVGSGEFDIFCESCSTSARDHCWFFCSEKSNSARYHSLFPFDVGQSFLGSESIEGHVHEAGGSSFGESGGSSFSGKEESGQGVSTKVQIIFAFNSFSFVRSGDIAEREFVDFVFVGGSGVGFEEDFDFSAIDMRAVLHPIVGVLARPV